MASALAVDVATDSMMAQPLPTITPTAAANRCWDVAVVGAGPAGALAAYELARRGAAVLLVDQAMFPRRKVCGCCLSGAAITTLKSVGLGALLEALRAVPLHTVQLAAGHQRAVLPLPAGVALSREQLDTALVHEAIRAGTAFLPKTRATLDRVMPSSRRLILDHDDEARTTVEARVVLAADGLRGTLLQHAPKFQMRSTGTSYIGVGTTIEHAPAAYSPGTIFMTGAHTGYVGMVRLEDGRLDIAAAVAPVTIRRHGRPHTVIAAMLRTAAMPPIDTLDQARWHGTPSLTCRRASLAAERVFVIGDAAGYVEPFTGEGIGWALACAVNVAPLALEAAQRWNPSLIQRWSTRYHRVLGQRQRRCWMLTQLLRHPALMQVALAILSQQPRLASPFIRSLHRPLLLPT